MAIQWQKNSLCWGSVVESACLWSKVYLFYLEQSQKTSGSAMNLYLDSVNSLPGISNIFFSLPSTLIVLIQQQKLIFNNSLTRCWYLSFASVFTQNKAIQIGLNQDTSFCKSTWIPLAGKTSSEAPDYQGSNWQGVMEAPRGQTAITTWKVYIYCNWSALLPTHQKYRFRCQLRIYCCTTSYYWRGEPKWFYDSKMYTDLLRKGKSPHGYPGYRHIHSQAGLRTP